VVPQPSVVHSNTVLSSSSEWAYEGLSSPYRYVSAGLMTVSNVGYFYHGFSVRVCSKYYMAAPVLKVIQIMISQAIVGYRTWNIAQRSKRAGVFLLFCGSVIAALECYSNLGSRIPLQDWDESVIPQDLGESIPVSAVGNCLSRNTTAGTPKWVFYLVATVFDAIAIALSSFFLIKSASGVKNMSSIIKMMFHDGLGHVVVLAASNVMNLVWYLNGVGDGDGSSCASFGYMVVWIMSQNILIHVREVAEVRARRGFITGRGTTQNSRSRKDGDGSSSFDVQVQIEHSVMVDDDLNIYRTPRAPKWGMKQGDTSNKDESSATQSQWELSSVSVAKIGEAV